MSINVNGTDVGSSISFNGTDLSEIIFNGVSVWTSTPNIISLPSTVNYAAGLFVYDGYLCLAQAHYTGEVLNNYHCMKLTSTGWENFFDYTVPNNSSNYSDSTSFQDVCVTDQYIKIVFYRKTSTSSSGYINAYPVCVNYKINNGTVSTYQLALKGSAQYNINAWFWFLDDTLMGYDNESKVYVKYLNTLSSGSNYSVVKNNFNLNGSLQRRVHWDENMISTNSADYSSSGSTSENSGKISLIDITGIYKNLSLINLYKKYCNKKWNYTSQKDTYAYCFSFFMANSKLYAFGATYDYSSTYKEKYEIWEVDVINDSNHTLIKTFPNDDSTFFNPETGASALLPFNMINNGVMYNDKLVWLNNYSNAKKILILDSNWNYSSLPLYES